MTPLGAAGDVKKPSHVERESAITPPVYVIRGPASIPRHQLITPVDGVIIDAGEHVCKAGLRIDVVELAVTISDDCGAVGAAFGVREQPAFAPKCKSAKGFGGIVRQTDSSIAKATRKVVPALELDWLSNRGRARQAGPLLAQPCFQGSQHKYELDLLRQRSLSAGYVSEFS
jgi:hypothetical protein